MGRRHYPPFKIRNLIQIILAAAILYQTSLSQGVGSDPFNNHNPLVLDTPIPKVPKRKPASPLAQQAKPDPKMTPKHPKFWELPNPMMILPKLWYDDPPMWPQEFPWPDEKPPTWPNTIPWVPDLLEYPPDKFPPEKPWNPEWFFKPPNWPKDIPYTWDVPNPPLDWFWLPPDWPKDEPWDPEYFWPPDDWPKDRPWNPLWFIRPPRWPQDKPWVPKWPWNDKPVTEPPNVKYFPKPKIPKKKPTKKPEKPGKKGVEPPKKKPAKPLTPTKPKIEKPKKPKTPENKPNKPLVKPPKSGEGPPTDPLDKPPKKGDGSPSEPKTKPPKHGSPSPLDSFKKPPKNGLGPSKPNHKPRPKKHKFDVNNLPRKNPGKGMNHPNFGKPDKEGLKPKDGDIDPKKPGKNGKKPHPLPGIEKPDKTGHHPNRGHGGKKNHKDLATNLKKKGPGSKLNPYLDKPDKYGVKPGEEK